MSDGRNDDKPRRGKGRSQIRVVVENPEPVTPAAQPTEPDAPKVPGFDMRKDGLYVLPMDSDRPPYRIADPFEVVAQARPEDDSHGWAIRLRWQNPDQRTVEALIPREALAGEAIEARKRLASGGLFIGGTNAAKAKLSEYLAAVASKVTARIRLVAQTGWYWPDGGPPVFVLPDRIIGTSTAEVVRLDLEPPPSIYRAKGTRDGWRREVARRCVGNSRLLFGVSAAFAAPLLQLVSDEGGGLNLRGESSKGKSTILDVAASVWGQPSKSGPDSFVRPWRATSNALEAVALSHNHALLPMDELGQADPREVGESLYMLANGAGKQRARASGGNRAVATWNTLVLSSSEESAASLAQQGGRRIKAGQEVRLLDVPAVVPGGFGCFEALHGEPDGQHFAQALRRAVVEHHGTAAGDFLGWLTARLAELPTFIADELERRIKTWLVATVPAEADGQVKRAARRFAVVAVAGELATAAGITGWPESAAEAAAATVFRGWLLDWGGLGSREDHHLFVAFRRWTTLHGSSRFETIKDGAEPEDGGQSEPALNDREKVINRAGWRWQEADDEGRRLWVYGMAPEVFTAEVAGPLGLEQRDACGRLGKAGMIRGQKQGDGMRWTIRPRSIPGAGRPRLIVTDSRIIEARPEGEAG
ncbi:MAG: DUF927 domain-containing protein [Roseicyclus sp.]